ncbi:MAG: methyltransferase domain-containing protein [Victivallaceae bacterium]|nr:methyltransferase domain-containing protein [Victivallaceae bacterium]
MRHEVDLKGPKITSSDYTEAHLKVYLFQTESGVQSRKIKIVSRYLNDLKGKKVLDIGIGGGFYSKLCKERGAEVLSLDHAEAIIEFHRKSKELNLIQADCTDMPIADASIDTVLALDMIEHLYEPEKFLQEVSRVLKTGGKMILVTDTCDYLRSKIKCRIPKLLHSFTGRLYAVFSDIFRKLKNLFRKSEPAVFNNDIRPKSTHVMIFETGELQELFKKYGFRILDFGTFAETKMYDLLHRIIYKFPYLRRHMWARVFFHLEKQ